MKEMLVEEIIEATKGDLIEGSLKTKIIGICQDSRLGARGYGFIAIKGDAFDGHDFIDMAIAKGVSLVIFDDKALVEAMKNKDVASILVSDSILAIQQIAKYYLSKINVKVIGITGSTGKTSTRDMTYYVCNEKFKTAKNKGNFNTVVGVPLTILDMDEDTEIAVLEMGMDRFGEIDTLANLTRPDIGLITNIGVSHLEHLGSRAGIFKAKMEIVNYFNKNNVLIISEGEDFLKAKNITGDYKVVVTGTSPQCDLAIRDIMETGDNSISFYIKNKEEEVLVELPVPGRHNALNAALAIGAGLELGISLKEAARGLKKMELTGKRLAIKDIDGKKIIDDTYNASPDSMKAALETLKNTKGSRRIAVLGDMFELGEDEILHHENIGKIARANADIVFTIGSLAKYISDENYYETKEEFIRENKNFFKEGDVILFKASRGMALELVIEELF